MEKHQEWLESVFGNEEILKRWQLVERLQKVSGHGNTAVEKSGGLITYYLDFELLIKEGTGKYRLPATF